MTSLDLDVDATTMLPPGRLALAVTWLEQREAPPLRADPPLDGVTLERLGAADCDRYLALYAAVGEPWLWFGRRILPRPALVAILADPGVEAFAVTRDGRDVGLVELDARDRHETELAYFGVTPAAIGGGLGRWMMNRALQRAWARAPRRVFVHTCTGDHPGALDFYRRSGFVPYAHGVEIATDPRLTGVLPRDCAPHLPLVDPAS